LILFLFDHKLLGFKSFVHIQREALLIHLWILRELNEMGFILIDSILRDLDGTDFISIKWILRGFDAFDFV